MDDESATGKIDELLFQYVGIRSLIFLAKNKIAVFYPDVLAEAGAK